MDEQRTEQLIHEELDHTLDREGQQELQRLVDQDPALAQELELQLALQQNLQALSCSPEAGLVDDIMRALPEQPDRPPLYLWILQPVRVPVWALGLVLAGFVGALLAVVAPQQPEKTTPTLVAGQPAATKDTPDAKKSGGDDLCPSPRMLVRFMLRAPKAKQVSLVGDFNDWSVDQNPLSDPDENGIWTISIPLDPGRYQYKFLVDGKQWVVEPDAQAYQPDGFGAQNALLVI